MPADDDPVRVTGYRVTMVPDTSGWGEGDLRWAAGWDRGIRYTTTDPAKAEEYAEIARGFGMTVTVTPVASDASPAAPAAS